MKIIVVGAGIIGISTAWHLAERGHAVTVIDRQSDAAMETSFANAGQISVSYCEPWANREAPLKALKWMFSKEAPLLFRPQNPLGEGWRQYRWGLQFLANCNDRAFERNVQQLVALGAYSHRALKEIIADTGIDFQRVERGIAHYYSDEVSFESAAKAAALMGKYGVDRKVISRAELLAIEPSLKNFAHKIVGGTFTASDESGDAMVFTQALAQQCAARGVTFLYKQAIQGIERNHQGQPTVTLQDSGPTLSADHVVVACGSYSAPLLRGAGIDLPIYPGKGYSATFDILKPQDAPMVSTIDDAKKIAITRLGDQIRVAGTIEVGSYDLTLESPLARARCHMLSKRVEEVWPGMCDTQTEEQGGNPRYWTGLRPATPTNIPFIGQTKIKGLWVNAGHGTLGWTHGAGSGKALAELICGESPAMAFKFYQG